MAAAGQDDSAASFIGALISLTSRSNMRYQGVLSNIDATQATLALEKGTLRPTPLTAVRSWGTEGRCASAGQPEDEVPGNEKVYDYIVFRAADVVDLRIDDPSPAKPAAAPTPTPAAAPAAAPAQPSPAPVTQTAASVRICPIRERTKSYGCKEDFDPAVRERFVSCG